VRDGDGRHVAEYEQGGDPGGDAQPAGFAALEGERAQSDVDEQGDELGGEPAVFERGEPEGEGERDAAGEQQGVVNVK
jgi:hypothetical protein